MATHTAVQCACNLLSAVQNVFVILMARRLHFSQQVVDIVGSQCLALLDALPSSAGIMEGHSWLAEAGGADGGGDDAEDAGPPPSLPSLAAALPPVATSGPAATSAGGATADASAAAAAPAAVDAAALVAAVARGQDAREAARDAVLAGSHPRQQEAAGAAAAAARAATQAGSTPTMSVPLPLQPQPQQLQPQERLQQRRPSVSGPTLPPRPGIESIGTQAGDSAAGALPSSASQPETTAAARRDLDEGSEEGSSDSEADALRRIEGWVKLQIGLAVLSVPALLVGLWLSRQ